MHRHHGGASLCNASLVHCFLVLGATYFWCCVFGDMHCQLYRAGLLPQWRIYFMIVTTVISCHIIVVKFSHLFNLIPTSTLFQVCFPCFTSSQWNDWAAETSSQRRKRDEEGRREWLGRERRRRGRGEEGMVGSLPPPSPPRTKFRRRTNSRTSARD